MSDPAKRSGCLIWIIGIQTAILVSLLVGVGVWSCWGRISAALSSAPDVANDPNPIVWYDTTHECEIRPFGAMESIKGHSVFGRLNGDTLWTEAGTERLHHDWHPSVTVGRKLKKAKEKAD